LIFRPKDPIVSKINCHAALGSPSQPRKLTSLKREQGIVLESVSLKFDVPVI